MAGCPYGFNCKTYIIEGKSIIVIFLQLHSSFNISLWILDGEDLGSLRMAEQVGLSYREAKWVVESDLFLDEYP